MDNFRRRHHLFFVTICLISLFLWSALGSQDCASGYAGDDSESFGSGANDVVVVQQSDGSLKSTAINVQVGKFSNWRTFVNSREGRVVKIFINGRRMRTTSPLIIGDSGKACFTRSSPRSGGGSNRFRFTDSELQSVNLTNNGSYEGQFVVD